MDNEWFFKALYEAIKKNPKLSLLDDTKIESLMSEVIEKTLPETASVFLKGLLENRMEMLEDHRLLREEFEARLQRRWSKAINLLETLIVISKESGEQCYIECVDSANKHDNVVFQVLVKIHARACQISYEILNLLRGGFADGAMSRWRTLHELSVLANFIVKNNDEVARMYLEYEHIERYYEMLEYVRYASELGYDALTEEEVNQITDMKTRLVTKYGKEFEKQFGWTMKVLPKNARDFKGLEESVDLNHLRPYYKLACNYVHLGPKASSFSLGMMDYSSLLLAGASNYGLADPGQNTSLSLTQITTCLLTIYPSYERLMTASAMSLLVEEICDSFVEIQSNIEKEELENENSDINCV